jgi:hypothetical protein
MAPAPAAADNCRWKTPHDLAGFPWVRAALLDSKRLWNSALVCGMNVPLGVREVFRLLLIYVQNAIS